MSVPLPGDWAGVGRMRVADMVAEATEVVTRLTPGEAFARVVGAGAVLVDTRDQVLRDSEGTVPGSIHIPRSVLEWRADPTSGHGDERLTAGAPIILMCSDGYSSVLAASNLVQLGHVGAGDVIGGYRAWKRVGLPVADVPGSAGELAATGSGRETHGPTRLPRLHP